jgi:hypothetical protein
MQEWAIIPPSKRRGTTNTSPYSNYGPLYSVDQMKNNSLRQQEFNYLCHCAQYLRCVTIGKRAIPRVRRYSGRAPWSPFLNLTKIDILKF